MISGVADTAGGNCANDQWHSGRMLLKRMPFTGAETLWLLRFYIEDVRHPAELGKRARLHLSHQVGAMHLYCSLRDADIVGYLFV